MKIKCKNIEVTFTDAELRALVNAAGKVTEAQIIEDNNRSGMKDHQRCDYSVFIDVWKKLYSFVGENEK